MAAAVTMGVPCWGGALCLSSSLSFELPSASEGGGEKWGEGKVRGSYSLFFPIHVIIGCQAEISKVEAVL